MSFAIPTVAPVTVTSNTVQPVAGATVQINTATPVVVTDSGAASTPVVVTGDGTLAVGTQKAQVVLDNGNINIGIARDANGNPLGMGGSVIQAQDDSTGSKVVNLDGANIGGAKVSGNVNLAGTGGGVGTIADNAPPGTFSGTPDTYIHTGAGNDEIQGSSGIDFIRAGAGNDVINAGAGNDIVRTGTGTDQVTLGQGNDVVYMTVDQLQGTFTKTISDFRTSGSDKIQIAKNLQGLVTITGKGTKQIVITLSGAQAGTTTIVSQGEVFRDEDIQFI